MSTTPNNPRPARTPATWNEHYETGQLPWDSGVPDHSLIETLNTPDIARSAVLEIGCGTGTNAIALTRLGFASVTATDLAPRAIEMAKAKAKAAGASVAFHVHDFLSLAPIPGVQPGTLDFVFDRGVFHSVTDADRLSFAARVAKLLKPASSPSGGASGSGGWWLSLCGNADDTTAGGPPRLTAAHIAAVVEPHFEIHTLSRARFRDIKREQETVYFNWKVLLRRRT